MRRFCTLIITVMLLAAFVCTFSACGKNDDGEEPDLAEQNFFAEWQNYIDDDARLVDVVMPGSHDSGTLNIGGNDVLNSLGETQSEGLYGQLVAGVRYFDVRVDVGKVKDADGNVIDRNALKIFHDVLNFGFTFDEVLDDINKFFDEYEGQFIVLDFQHFADDVEPRVRLALEEKLNTDEYAVKNTENLSELTYGDVRDDGLRYIIVWGSTDVGETDYVFPRTSSLLSPYETEYHNFGTDYLINTGFEYYWSCASANKFFVLQAQLTPSFNVENSVTGSVAKLEQGNNDIMNAYVRALASDENSELLNKTNIVMRDYVNLDAEKQRASLSLNLAKNTVKSDDVALFEKMTAKE